MNFFSKRAFFFLALLASELAHAKTQPPNFLLILSEGISSAQLLPYGYSRNTTPTLTRLANSGWAIPALYGVSPSAKDNDFALFHGRTKFQNTLHPAKSTFLTRLRTLGYRTASFGLTTAEVQLPENLRKHWKSQLTLTTQQAQQFIGQSSSSPFFLVVRYPPPQAPLSLAPLRFNRNSSYFVERYDNALSELDRQIQILVKSLKNVPNTTYVFFSSLSGAPTPGQIHWAHSAAPNFGRFRGSLGSLYEGGIRLPLIVFGPKLKRAVSASSYLSVTDLYSLIVDVATKPSGNLWDEIKRVSSSQKAVFFEAPRPQKGAVLHQAPELGIRKGHWKLLINLSGKRKELYWLDEKGAIEMDNRIGEFPQLAQQLESELRSWHSSLLKHSHDPKAGKRQTPWLGFSLSRSH